VVATFDGMGGSIEFEALVAQSMGSNRYGGVIAKAAWYPGESRLFGHLVVV
jgi:hypothetical protein